MPMAHSQKLVEEEERQAYSGQIPRAKQNTNEYTRQNDKSEET
jgi:hypothetical protein